MRTVGGRSVTALVAVGLATLLAATACGGSSANDAGGTSTAAPAQRDQSAPKEGAPDQGAKTGAALTVPVGSPVDTRSIVYKGEMTVRASDVDRAASEASTIATGAAGVVAGDNRRDNGADSTADLVIRVPAKSFYGTVEKLSDLGKELTRGISTEDVTEAVVDLDARIASQKASVDRTRALLGRAQQITDIVTIEQELARREAELGSLQARQRSLADQVTLSTITLHLVGPKAPAVKEKDEAENFLTGLAAGWDAFVTSVNGALIVLGAMLPFLVAIGIPVWLAVWLLRRRRPQPVPPAPAPAPEA